METRSKPPLPLLLLIFGASLVIIVLLVLITQEVSAMLEPGGVRL